MKTFPMTAKGSDRRIAFEIANVFISLAKITRLLEGIDGVTDVQQRRMFSESSDIHIEFKYRGQPYVVWEPFGDNSRYWIGPKHIADDVYEIDQVEDAFKSYRSTIRRILDNILPRFGA